MPSIQNKIMLRDMKNQIGENPYLFLSQFQRLSVDQVSELRKSLKDQSEVSFVIKNSLSKIVFDEMGFEGLSSFLEGQTIITVASSDPQNVSKTLVNFSKANKGSFKVNGAWIEGQAVPAEEVTMLASLPSKQELLTKVVVGMNSPIAGFVVTLNGVVQSFVRVLNEIAQKSEQK